jgi:uncharacterized protein
MIQRGIASFGLDGGHCPPWLFKRMVALGREMTRVLVAEYGPDEFIRRIADPVWFQSLGTVLAFDWNASGLTTILTAALKEAIRGEERELGIFICGGKGATSRKTPDEIRAWGERLALAEAPTENLVYNSKMSAKVDSALVQDGFQLYHHAFFFSLSSRQGSARAAATGQSKIGSWAVVQQGMNTEAAKARRYHWFSENIDDLVAEPHAAISSPVVMNRVLNLTANKSAQTRELSTELVQAGYFSVMKDIQLLRKHSSRLSQMVKLRQRGQGGLFDSPEQPDKDARELTVLNLESREFKYHPVVHEDFARSKYLEKILAKVTDRKPENYEKLVAMEGVGPKTVRALALVGEVIYGANPSYEDPARYSFAHGGKDATPYAVDRKTYDQTIHILGEAVRKTRLAPDEKRRALGRLFDQEPKR